MLLYQILASATHGKISKSQTKTTSVINSDY